jgi:hypothetical protein
MPGPNYWQQRADYDIHVTLDTSAEKIDGAETIQYTNNAPTALYFIWLQLDQNAFRPDSEFSLLNARRPHSKEGLVIDRISIDRSVVVPTIIGTRARVDLPHPVSARGGRVRIVIAFHFVVPLQDVPRMGHRGSVFLLGQWYPRMTVYDDVHGWNTDEYDGREFYLEYGDFNYEVTLPAAYTVVGSGVLTNPVQVLTRDQRLRLARARRGAQVVSVITADEARDTASRRNIRTTKTWQFVARNVRDVAWAAAPDFRWDATSSNGVLCQALYPVDSSQILEHAAEFTRWTIKWFSEHLAQFPFPQQTTVAAGPAMEYPMLGSIDRFTKEHPGSLSSLFYVINHESGGHQYFPMVVGSDERRYAWMDESLNGVYNAIATEDAICEGLFHAELRPWFPFHTDERILSARKQHFVFYEPVALAALRDQVIGRETFDLAIKTYYRRWANRHPTPDDFFQTLANVTGQDLTWFWSEFDYQQDVLDLGIDGVFVDKSVVSPTSSSGVKSVVRVHRYTTFLFPIALRVKFADGTMRDLHVPASWITPSSVDIPVWGNTAVVGARLWPAQMRDMSQDSTQPSENSGRGLPLGSVPDVNSVNDAWGDAPTVGVVSTVCR